jgi:hypothetical protein
VEPQKWKKDNNMSPSMINYPNIRKLDVPRAFGVQLEKNMLLASLSRT